MEAAERLKISAENLNSMLSTSLKKISDTKKRTRKLKAVSILRKKSKKEEIKLEIPSVFKKSVQKIESKVSTVSSDLFGNILGFVSLLVLGTVVTNIDKIKEALDKAREKITKNLKPVVENVKAIFEGIQGFIDLFNSSDRDKEYNELLKTTEELKKVEEKFLGIKKDAENLEKIYKDVKDGKYASKKGFVLNEKGELTTGEKFTYDKSRKKPYEVTNPDGSTDSYSFEEFFAKYRETDLSNIVTKDESLPNVGMDYSFSKVLNEYDFYNNFSNVKDDRKNRSLFELLYNSESINEIENQTIIYQKQTIITDQEP